MAPSSIQLTLVNQSEEEDDANVVLVTENFAPGYEATPLAWRVIQNLGRGDTHPFTFPLAFTIGAQDSWGNDTPQQTAMEGQAFDMVQAASGDELQLSGTPAKSEKEIVLRNKLPKGAVTANLFRDGLLTSTVTNLAPGQDGAFSMKPEFRIGVIRNVTEGTTLSGAELDEIPTRIVLLGILSADIVWQGGGTGPDAKPYTFKHENVINA